MIRFRLPATLLTAALTLAWPGIPRAQAAPVQATQPLSVHDAYVPEAPPGTAMLAGYVTVTNPSRQTITLVGASSPDFATVTMHQTQHHDHMASMAPIKSLTIPAGGSRAFAPGGYHFMLMGPKRKLHAGDTVHLTLMFADHRQQTLALPVRDVRQSAPMSDMAMPPGHSM